VSQNEISGDLDKTGIDQNDPSRVTRYAIIKVVISAAPDDENAPLKYSKQVDAMIDTGATNSSVSETLAAELHLDVVGYDTGIGMDGKLARFPLYRASIEVPAIPCHWNRWFFMRNGGGQGVFDVIIGNDLLASCVFTVDGPAGRFMLRYVGRQDVTTPE
jgi:hypothetical protein